MSNNFKTNPKEDLAKVLSDIESSQEMNSFLTDLCTPAELRALSERWHVAKILDSNEKSYRQINSETGVSTTTIARVARFLRDEPHQGYRTVLNRLERIKNNTMLFFRCFVFLSILYHLRDVLLFGS